LVFRLPARNARGRTVFSNDKRFFVCLKSTKTTIAKSHRLLFANNSFHWNEGDEGYVASFDKSFFSRKIWGLLQSKNFFKKDTYLYFDLDDECVVQLSKIFDNMCGTLNSPYIYKYDLLRNYMFEIIHLTLKKSSGVV